MFFSQPQIGKEGEVIASHDGKGGDNDSEDGGADSLSVSEEDMIHARKGRIGVCGVVAGEEQATQQRMGSIRSITGQGRLPRRRRRTAERFMKNPPLNGMPCQIWGGNSMEMASSDA